MGTKAGLPYLAVSYPALANIDLSHDARATFKPTVIGQRYSNRILSSGAKASCIIRPISGANAKSHIGVLLTHAFSGGGLLASESIDKNSYTNQFSIPVPNVVPFAAGVYELQKLYETGPLIFRFPIVPLQLFLGLTLLSCSRAK